MTLPHPPFTAKEGSSGQATASPRKSYPLSGLCSSPTWNTRPKSSALKPAEQSELIGSKQIAFSTFPAENFKNIQLHPATLGSAPCKPFAWFILMLQSWMRSILAAEPPEKELARDFFDCHQLSWGRQAGTPTQIEWEIFEITEINRPQRVIWKVLLFLLGCKNRFV